VKAIGVFPEADDRIRGRARFRCAVKRPPTLQEAKPEAGSISWQTVFWHRGAAGCGSQTGVKPRSRSSRTEQSPRPTAFSNVLSTRRLVTPTKTNRGGRAASKTTRGPGTPETARHPSAGINLRGAQKTQEHRRARNAGRKALTRQSARLTNRPARP
jgi:hypothetical protein